MKMKGLGYYCLLVCFGLLETQNNLCVWRFGIKGVTPPLPAWEPGITSQGKPSRP